MARVTVEDCLKNVKNRFELVIVAAKRARQLMRGKESRVEWDNDKATVVALREIAAGHTNFQNVHTTETQELSLVLTTNKDKDKDKEEIKISNSETEIIIPSDVSSDSVDKE